MTNDDKTSHESDKDAITSASVTKAEFGVDDFTQESESTPEGIASSAEVKERLRRADALQSAKRALDLADQLKLVSLNVAIESAKTRTASVDLKQVKQDLSTLTNKAVKASREIGGMINAINSGEPIVSSQDSDFRKAVQLKQELKAILDQSQRVLDSIDRLESR